jgi:transcriptional regulator with XRE-family HTH domain
MPSVQAAGPIPQKFKLVCRQWRKQRKLSQLDLALAANISQRHLSWLETGRSQPSPDMVEKISDALEIPLRERNVMLQAAGYTPAYKETPLDETIMAPVLDAIELILQNHQPLPAVVVDRFWNVKKQNKAAELLFGLAGDIDDVLEDIGNDGEFNLALLTIHPKGLRQYITNWDQAAPPFINRLKSEQLASPDPELQAKFGQLIKLAGFMNESEPVAASLLPIIPLEINVNGLELSLFSVISTFGTPQDITTDELRIEAFYPADDATKAFFNSLNN